MRVLVVVAALLWSGFASAQVVSEAAVEALRLAGDEEWNAAKSQANSRAAETVAPDLVEWLRLRSGDGEFEDYQRFVRARPDWPGLDRLRARGEEAIPVNADPGEVLQWFGDLRPQTGEGALRLAQALSARGLEKLAQDVVETAWVDLRLSEDGHAALVERYAAVIEPYHADRVDALLWRWRTEEAGWMLELLSDDQRALAEARIAYIRKQDDLADKLDAVPSDLVNHPGLVYDHYNWLADKGRRAEAVAIALARSESVETLGQPFRWSGWRRSLARWEMRQGRHSRAYELASKHFLTDGSSFADLEWLSGYLSLRYLDAPSRALAHFQNARTAVDSPISVARNEYWIGRALDDLGDPAATAAYRRAAVHQTAFYGLIASEKLSLPLNAALTGRADADDWQDSELLENELVQAALILIKAGERGSAVTFMVELGKSLPRDDLARLGALLENESESFFEVLLGKTAVTQGILVPSIYFPIHDLAEMDLPVDPALSLSIARRESEFNAGVGSPVGALGLMQLMPATAEEVAGFLDLPYSRNRLTADWQYNAQLGAKYLAILEEKFGYSPVQIAAGYNAGPSRPEMWMDERGDPRLGEVDVIDWIEHIPFRETRNYVMRVTESIPIYEARLTGAVGPVQFFELLTGIKPNKRPEARPEVTVSVQNDGSSIIIRPLGEGELRPAARPSN